MQKIPKMISTKDLSYISDIFNWNITSSYKISELLNICHDKDVCKELNNMYDIHLSNCEKILNLLESVGASGR